MAEERPAAAVSGCRDAREVRDSILLTTVDEAGWGVSIWAIGVDFFEETLVVTVVGVFPAILVREARLLLLVLLPTAENVRAWAEGVAVCALLEATSTVLLTGLDGAVLLLEELLETADMFG